MKPEFWKGRRTLVTGHTGFKGAWLCLWLGALGAETHGYALPPPTEPSLYERAGVGSLVDSTIADVRDYARVRETFERVRPDVVFHMAAQSLVLRSYEEPVETYSTNVLGTVHLLEAVRRAGLACAVVNVTTDKVYENLGLARGYTEEDELGGHDPYSSSKAASELVSAAYRSSFFSHEDAGEQAALATARAGNVIGGGDWTPGQLIPDAIAAYAAHQPVSLRHPSAVRPWQHVLDCLAGYLALAERLHADPASYSGAWNFGPPEANCLPVSELVEALAVRMEIDETWALDTIEHSPEEAVLRLDSTKSLERLGWQPILSIGTTLDWVVHWYGAFAQGADAGDLCREQIVEYGGMVGRQPAMRPADDNRMPACENRGAGRA